MMENPRRTATNAADSAPGVDDGPSRASGAPVDSYPKGRKAVFVALAALIAVLIVVFIAKPEGTSRQDPGAAVAPTARTGSTTGQPAAP